MPLIFDQKCLSDKERNEALKQKALEESNAIALQPTRETATSPKGRGQK